MDTPFSPGRQSGAWEPSTANRRRTQKMMDKFRKPTNTPAEGQAFKTRDDSHEAERSFNDEMALFYHGPQPTRGAGNNPGLGSAHRGFQNDNPNTPFSVRGHGMSPISTSQLYTTQRGPLSPLDRTGAPSPVPLAALQGDDMMPSRAMGMGGAGAGGRCACPCCRCGGPCCSGGGQVDQGLWVTLFGFPQGYQDGMLKILRDRGEILEHSYSGTNHISVKFKTPEAVADAVGLNGSILPADGLPGENYMIGVKRGAALIERGDAAASAAEPAKRVQREGIGRLGGGAGASARGGGREPKAPERGLMGRIWSELLDITDLSIRD